VWTISPQGAIIVGVSDTYRFEVRHLDGTTTVIERDIEPPEVIDVEAEWSRRFVEGGFGWTAGGKRVPLDWDKEIPPAKPAFERFIATTTGEVWVHRLGRAVAVRDCTLAPIRRMGLDRVPRPCHRSPQIVDVFDLSGRYLGEVDIPDGFLLTTPWPFIRGDTVIGLVIDDSDLRMVKRFRLVRPSASETRRR
jgi:hypothetical protein